MLDRCFLAVNFMYTSISYRLFNGKCCLHRKVLVMDVRGSPGKVGTLLVSLLLSYRCKNSNLRFGYYLNPHFQNLKNCICLFFYFNIRRRKNSRKERKEITSQAKDGRCILQMIQIILQIIAYSYTR
jgi:hypothetical protein